MQAIHLDFDPRKPQANLHAERGFGSSREVLVGFGAVIARAADDRRRALGVRELVNGATLSFVRRGAHDLEGSEHVRRFRAVPIAATTPESDKRARGGRAEFRRSPRDPAEPA